MHKTKPIMFMLATFLCGALLGCGANSGSQGTAPNPPSVTTTSLRTGAVGAAYSEALQATGGVFPYKWSEFSGGALPAGLTLDGNGAIAGTPSATGEYGPYVFQVIDGNGLKSSSAPLPLTIANHAASTCSPRGNEAALNASTPYAFLLNGYDFNDRALAIAGSFTPHGDGTISGEVDYDGVGLGQGHAALDPSASGYAFGDDARGCLFLSLSGVKTPSTFTFSFSLGAKNSSGVYSAGHIIEFDNLTATMHLQDPPAVGSNTDGTMHLQDPNSFRLDALESNYAFGLINAGSEGIAGTFANHAGTLSAGLADFPSFMSEPLTDGGGVINGPFSTNGRTTGNYSLNAALTFHFAIYMVGSSDFYIIETDDFSLENNPNSLQISGRALATAASFGNKPLNGDYLLAAISGEAGAPPIENFAEIGSFQALNTGAVPEATISSGEAGRVTKHVYSNGSYVSNTQGRVTFTGLGSNPPIVYLTSGGDAGNSIQGFTVSSPLFSGVLIDQNTSSPNFSVADLHGLYSGGIVQDPDGFNGGVVFTCGFDGAGRFTITFDEFSDGLQALAGSTFSGSYTVNPDGSGTFDMDPSPAGNIIDHLIFVTNGQQIYAITNFLAADSKLFVFDAGRLP